MAQQTINVGAAPNDGTGTPLRTAFQYTNSNFSELYTAVGPSGNNITVPGTATITGDLGVGTASPSTKLEVATATANTRLRINSTSVVATEYFRSGTGLWLVGSDSTNAFKIARGSNFGGSADYFSIGSATADCTWFDAAGGTRMTLNATGLGVGVVPSAGKFEVQESGTGSGIGGIFTSTVSGGGNPGVVFRTASTNRWSLSLTGSAGAESIRFYDINNSATRLLIDSSGNVGIGVTPSATNSTYFQALEIARVGQGLTAAKNALTGSPSSWLSNNSYATYSSGIVWNYAISQPAAQYRLFEGQHQWFNAPSGTAGNAITFTQAMTLDASGNLLVGKTATNSNTVGVEIQPNGNVWATKSASTSAATAWDTYSTGAGAYRFYVGMNGTINATNTTISAISDARLKENVQDIDVGLGAILALKPRKFDWKAGKGKDIKGDRGFIAQEFEQVFPNLIDEWKDPAPEGEAPYKSVRQDLIPVLVKAIQELTARVQTLETR